MMSYKQRKSNVLGTDSARIRGRYLFCSEAAKVTGTLPEMRYLYSFTSGLSESKLVTGVSPDPPDR
jgi:hypothetical protein